MPRYRAFLSSVGAAARPLAGLGFILILLCLMGAGCFLQGDTGARGPTGPIGRVPLLVSGMIYAVDPQYPDGYVSIFTQNSGDVPTVLLDGHPVPYRAVGQFAAASGNFVSYHPALSAGDSANVVITFTSTTGVAGTARARFLLPGAFQMTRPSPDSSTLQITQPLRVAWTGSRGSAGYEVDAYFTCTYVDLFNTPRNFAVTLDTLVTADSVSFPTTVVFPPADSTASVGAGSGWVTVYAVDGPLHEGDPDNVTGDGAGSILGITRGGFQTIQTASTSGRPLSPDRRTRPGLPPPTKQMRPGRPGDSALASAVREAGRR